MPPAKSGLLSVALVWATVCGVARGGGGDVGPGRPARRLTSESPQELVSGVFGSIFVETAVTPGLERAGRVRVRPSESVCGAPGSKRMSPAVQPSCSGHICLGPTTREGDKVMWTYMRIVNPGLYRLCWCEPQTSCAGVDADLGGPGCCLDDASFSRDAGTVAVHGPQWIEVHPYVGQAFNLHLLGIGADLDPSSKVMLRRAEGEDSGACGDDMRESEVGAAVIDEEASLWAQRSQESGTVLVARVFRNVPFHVCWCPGSMLIHGPTQGVCSEDWMYAAVIGTVLPFGAETESAPLQTAVAGSTFSVSVFGDLLGIGDRVRVVDWDQQCGTDGSSHSRSVAMYICDRGTGRQCVASPVMGGKPSTIEQIAPTVWRETWSPVQVYDPGEYRLCWCVDQTWDPVLMDAAGYCVYNKHFAVSVGTLLIQGVKQNQMFACEAFTSCTMHVQSDLPFASDDELLVIEQDSRWSMRCGRGTLGFRVPMISANVTGNDTAGAHEGVFRLPQSGQPGAYGVCYCHAATTGPCGDDPSAFSQLAGALSIGAATSSVTMLQTLPQICDSLLQCTIAMEGVWALQTTNLDAFYAAPGEERCGSHVGDDVNLPIFTLSKKRVLPGTWEATFIHDARSRYPAGDYKLCYCVGVMAPGGLCQDLRHFEQEVGSLHVVGVNQTSTWSCDQGFMCNFTLPGWRMSHDDRAMLIHEDVACGSQTGPSSAWVAVGFDQNPTAEPFIEDLSGNWTLEHFALGRAGGVGDWRVCFCSALMASTGCTDMADFKQDVGIMSVHGSLKTVSAMPYQPASADFISVVVDVELPGFLACAVSKQELPEPPSILDVMWCKMRMPGCLGSATLGWRSVKGPNSLHIPISVNRTNLTGAPLPLPMAHVWCSGDHIYCPSGRCTIPSTQAGWTTELRNGIVPWTEWHAAKQRPFRFEVRGDPLNTISGRLETFIRRGEGQECGGRPDEAVPIGSPPHFSASEWVAWPELVMQQPGQYVVCWCDRGYGKECARWQQIGLLVVAGPIENSPVPAMMNPQQVFPVNLSGVNLSHADSLAVIPGEDCSGGGGGMQMIAPDALSQPTWANGTAAQWNMSVPAATLGNITVCWGQGGVLSTAIARAQVEVRQDCVLGEWELVSADSTGMPVCSRPCGGGAYELHKKVLLKPSGGGAACPAEATLSRLEPCNSQPCPALEALRAWTQPELVLPGMVFQVFVEGTDFIPIEDRVLLISGRASCGEYVPHFGGASCERAGSSTEQLVCGDGEFSMQVDVPGLFQICICDADKSLNTSNMALHNSSEGPCSNITDYKLSPRSGTLLQVGVANGTLPDPSSHADFDNIDGTGTGNALGHLPVPEAPASGALERHQHFERGGSTAQSTLILFGVIIAATLPIWAVCSWWCVRRQSRRRRASTTRSAVAQDIVEKATMEVWNAYQRTFVESIGGVVGDDEKDGKAAFSSTDSTYEGESRPSTDGSGATTPALPGSEGGAVEGQPTPPGTAGSLRSSLHTPPPSGGSARSGGSIKRQSFMQMELAPAGSAITPKMGGCFLNMPLGVKPAVSQPALSETEVDDAGAAASVRDDEAMKDTGSTWWSGDGTRAPSKLSTPARSRSGSPRNIEQAASARALRSLPMPEPLARPSTPLDAPPCMPGLAPLELPERPEETSARSAREVQRPLRTEPSPPPFDPPEIPSSSSTARPPGRASSKEPIGAQAPPSPEPARAETVSSAPGGSSPQVTSSPPRGRPPRKPPRVPKKLPSMAPPLMLAPPESPSGPPPGSVALDATVEVQAEEGSADGAASAAVGAAATLSSLWGQLRGSGNLEEEGGATIAAEAPMSSAPPAPPGRLARDATGPATPRESPPEGASRNPSKDGLLDDHGREAPREAGSEAPSETDVVAGHSAPSEVIEGKLAATLITDVEEPIATTTVDVAAAPLAASIEQDAAAPPPPSLPVLLEPPSSPPTLGSPLGRTSLTQWRPSKLLEPSSITSKVAEPPGRPSLGQWRPSMLLGPPASSSTSQIPSPSSSQGTPLARSSLSQWRPSALLESRSELSDSPSSSPSASQPALKSDLEKPSLARWRPSKLLEGSTSEPPVPEHVPPAPPESLPPEFESPPMTPTSPAGPPGSSQSLVEEAEHRVEAGQPLQEAPDVEGTEDESWEEPEEPDQPDQPDQPLPASPMVEDSEASLEIMRCHSQSGVGGCGPRHAVVGWPSPQIGGASGSSARRAGTPAQEEEGEEEQEDDLPLALQSCRSDAVASSFFPDSSRCGHQEFLDAQEKLRAEWHAQLAADPHLRSAAPRASLGGSRFGSSLRAAAAARGGVPSVAAGSDDPPPVAMGFRKPRNSETTFDFSMGPSLSAPKGPGAPLPGPPLSGAPALGGPSGPGGPQRPLAPNWAFFAP